MFDDHDPAASLTERQRAVFEVVRSYADQHGYPPTVREIGRMLGLASSSTVHSHLAALERAGVLQRDPTKPRALRWCGPGRDGSGRGPAALEGGTRSQTGAAAGMRAGAAAADGLDVEPAQPLPVLGRVAAGEPLLAEQHVEQYVPVPMSLARAGESFVLRISGDSMVDAGILDGDLVVVRRQRDVANGQVVIALVDDEATCKRFFMRDGKVVLQPENATMEPIVPESCEIVGVVTGLMRTF